VFVSVPVEFKDLAKRDKRKREGIANETSDKGNLKTFAERRPSSRIRSLASRSMSVRSPFDSSFTTRG